ncbi:class I SAM-dependent methyltransferase [Actinoplanes sp. CA-252034]|uniref:class I SAM-dependent methyltransferase n=1 Tax=Actinoplanes sp. CA-252034 TaxID=3239906 RepID=UPI003D991D56
MRTARELAFLGDPAVVADLGCGDGVLTAALAARLPGVASWLLLDRDTDLVARARQAVAAATGAPVLAVTGDLAHAPLSRRLPGPALVVLAHSLYYVPGWAGVLDRLLTAPLPGGSVIAVVLRTTESASYRLRAAVRAARGQPTSAMVTGEMVEEWLTRRDVPFRTATIRSRVGRPLAFRDQAGLIRLLADDDDLRNVLTLLCHADPWTLGYSLFAALSGMMHDGVLNLSLVDRVIVIPYRNQEETCPIWT